MLKLLLINSIKQMEYSSVTMCCKVTGGWQILLMNHREDTLARWKRVKIIMSDIENSLQIKLCYHELSTLWCSFAVQVEYGWTDRCKSTDTTSQKVINWQQSYERHFNVSENENVHIKSSQFVHCVRSSITTCCIFYPYVGVYNQSNEIFGNSCLSYTISSS